MPGPNPTIPTGLSLAAFLSAVLPAPAEDPTVLLRPTFEPGTAAYIELVQKMDTTLIGGQFGTGLEVRVDQVFGVMQRVERRRKRGNTRLTLTFDRLKMAFQSAVMSASFDSDTDDPDRSDHVLAAIYGAMVGMPMRMEIGPDGRARSFSGMSAILAKVEDAASGNPIFEHMIRNRQFDDDVARVRWGEARFALFPYRRVKLDDTWKTVVREPGTFGELVSDYNCQLTRLERLEDGALAEVTFHGTIRRFDDVATAPGPLGSIMKFRSGNFEGTASFDSQVGAFVRQQTRTEMLIDLTLPGLAQDRAAALQIKESIDSTLILMTPLERRRQKAQNKLEARRQARKKVHKKPR